MWRPCFQIASAILEALQDPAWQTQKKGKTGGNAFFACGTERGHHKLSGAMWIIYGGFREPENLIFKSGRTDPEFVTNPRGGPEGKGLTTIGLLIK